MLFRRLPRSKPHPRAEHPEILEENRAPVRSILDFLKKIALPRGASSKFRRILRSNSRYHAEHPEQLIKLRSGAEHPEILNNITLPGGAS